MRHLTSLLATSTDPFRTADPNAPSHAWDGSWAPRELPADAAVSKCEWEPAAEGFREQPRPISTVSLPARDPYTCVYCALSI